MQPSDSVSLMQPIENTKSDPSFNFQRLHSLVPHLALGILRRTRSSNSPPNAPVCNAGIFIQETFLNVLGQVQQLHHLGDPGPRDALLPGNIRLPNALLLDQLPPLQGFPNGDSRRRWSGDGLAIERPGWYLTG